MNLSDKDKKILSTCAESGGGKKYDDGKLRYDLFPPIALDEIAKVYTYGANQYGDRYWDDGIKWGRLFAATMRHLWSFWTGEDRDQESGILHLAHAGCNITMLIWHLYNRTDLDNRPAK